MSLEREIEGLPVVAVYIACCPNGDMVVAREYGNAFILDSDGKSKAILESTETEHNKQLNSIAGVAVSPLGYILILGGKVVWVFDLQGKYLHCFDTLTPDDDPNTDVGLACIAVDREGQVLVGDNRDIITIHTYPEGKVTRKVKCIIGFDPSIVVNSKNQILLHVLPSISVGSEVVAIDYSGNEAFSFTPRIDDENVTDYGAWPFGIVCDEKDYIYISMRVTGIGYTGHIHKYSPTGGFLQCIAQGLYWLFDLSFSPDGSLMVANAESILKYTRKKKL